MPDGKYPNRNTKLIKLSFILITGLFFAILYVYSIIYHNGQQDRARDRALIAANSQRIADIQASRTMSCQRTYSGIKEVFAPFIPKHPATEEQAENIRIFNENISKLIAGCVKQTNPKNKKKLNSFVP